MDMRHIFYSGVRSVCIIGLLSVPNWTSDITPAVLLVTAETTIPSALVPEVLPRDSVELIFTGDVLLGRFVETLVERNDPGHLTQYMTSFMNDRNRIVVTNFESAMAVPHTHSPNGSFAFSTQAENLVTLKELNIQFASLANNHALDFGRSGYENAIVTLGAADIKAFGHPTVLSDASVAYIQSGDYVIALIGIHTLFGDPDVTAVKSVLTTAQQKSDVQIAYVHWGVEYKRTHSPQQARFAASLVENGIDAVIGHHPHVTQDIQLINEVPVFYSLGNFIFDQYFSEDVQEGYLVGVVVQSDKLEFQLYPHNSRQGLSVTSLSDPQERSLFLQDLANKSDERLAVEIATGTLKIPWKND